MLDGAFEYPPPSEYMTYITHTTFTTYTTYNNTQQARAGEIKNFTGIDDPYEIPANPEITINTADLSIQQSVDALIDELAKRGIVRM